MDCGHSKTARMNVEVDTDRLSMLPDDLIHKILSRISIKYVVRTCVLSSRWRFIWTSMPYLTFPVQDYNRFSENVDHEFLNNVLTHRNNQIEVHSVELSFHERFSHVLLKRVLDYAFSHNVQQLSVACLRDDEIDLPLDLFCSHSLKCLTLIGSFTCILKAYSIILVSTWELPVLTKLNLDFVAFSEEDGIGLFSKCANLKSLTLTNFTILDTYSLTVSHPGLSNLTLEDGYWSVDAVNVVAPQLKNLTIRNSYGKHMITAPNLASLIFNGSCPLQFSADLPSLEKVDICIWSTEKWSAYTITCLLQQLHNVKFLTLNLEFILPLSRFMERISLQLSLFSKLKSLKVYPVYELSEDEADRKETMSTKVINYLLDGSPTATFRMISYKELKEKEQKAREFANASVAQNRMDSLQIMLNREKTEIEETSKTYMDRMKKEMESHEAEIHDQGNTQIKKIHLHFERKMEQIKSGWDDVGMQIDRWRSKICFYISQLCDIEALLLKDLPTSKRDELQASFSRLCAEVDTVVKKMLHHMNIPQIHLRDCFTELATTSLASD